MLAILFQEKRKKCSFSQKNAEKNASTIEKGLRVKRLKFSNHYFIAAFVFPSRNSSIPAQSVTHAVFSRSLQVRHFVVYSISKLRRFKNRNGETEAKIIFLLTWAH